MTAVAESSADEAVSPATVAATSGRVPAVVHEHAWSLMRFELEDDRPVVRQSCGTCGLVRGYRAWERHWTPGEGEIRR